MRHIIRRYRTHIYVTLTLALFIALGYGFIPYLIYSIRVVAYTGHFPDSAVYNDNAIPGPIDLSGTIWSHEPMLATFPAGKYKGKVVVEIWSQGDFIFYFPSTDDPKAASLLKNATRALQNTSQANVLTSAPWSSDPVMGVLSDQEYYGRVVIEVGDDISAIAITGSASTFELIQRAITRIEEER